MDITKIFISKELAQNFMQAPKVIERGDSSTLIFDYESETGEYLWTGILFYETLAWRHIKDSQVNEYMVKSYYCLSVISDSKWNEDYNAGKDYNHYLVYFDGYGTYEFSYGLHRGV